jgi:hypothetical protein
MSRSDDHHDRDPPPNAELAERIARVETTRNTHTIHLEGDRTS